MCRQFHRPLPRHPPIQDALYLCVFLELLSRLVLVYPRVVSGVWVSRDLNVNYTWQAMCLNAWPPAQVPIWEDCGTLRRWDLLTGSESQWGVGLEALQTGSTSCCFSAFWVQMQCGQPASRSCVCVFPACHHDFSTTMDCVPWNCEMKPTPWVNSTESLLSVCFITASGKKTKAEW